jgi:hypothetical protein
VQDFKGDGKSLLAGRDVNVNDRSDNPDDKNIKLLRRKADRTMLRIQTLQVTLLLIVLIMLIVNNVMLIITNVRFDAADVERHRLRATLDMYMLVNSQKDK